MPSEQAILSHLDESSKRGDRPERAQAALSGVADLEQQMLDLEVKLEQATLDAEGRLQAAARHLVGSGGKRVRPTLTLLAAGACGGELRAAVPFAVAAELTHSATLLHDDVIDDGPERRGRPASRVIWGNAVSVLSGDWLLARALEIVSAEPARSAALPALLATMRRLVEGEVLQLSLRGTFAASERDYLDVVRGKTGSLFGWAAAAGAWSAGLTGRVPEALARFGEDVGIAFQLVDDALDYGADPQLLGKRLGSDLTEGKATLPLIRACAADPGLKSRLPAVLEGEDAARRLATEVIDAVRRVGGLEAARDLARQHSGTALEALELVPDGPHRRALRDAALTLTERSF
ncbi:MAG TPA: polyprenyl synthetase family protein [Anaeromyxobacter sp.]|nr:polyprenyl synthetase family protein [Anaeromyxobacter sp.]